MRTPPNHALQRTRRERRGCNPHVLCAGSLSWVVRRRAHVELRERFFHRRCAQIDADSFRVFRTFRGYIPSAEAWPAVAASLEILAGEF